VASGNLVARKFEVKLLTIKLNGWHVESLKELREKNTIYCEALLFLFYFGQQLVQKCRFSTMVAAGSLLCFFGCIFCVTLFKILF